MLCADIVRCRVMFSKCVVRPFVERAEDDLIGGEGMVLVVGRHAPVSAGWTKRNPVSGSAVRAMLLGDGLTASRERGTM